ncbi:Type II secretion system protein G [Tepidimonas fonticaldi]|uniref:Type II secretion system core protein G n=1 Tax=Tepidimonas fonticaldi TaxID=1101373 RepID=A0A554XIL7_9BURK|nr:type II secretion system major pseudopilin GspG [Tepidimonas fonticaldi]TSE35683.1 Type II secretion system protein G [Tepidimonas fonticaldi]
MNVVRTLQASVSPTARGVRARPRATGFTLVELLVVLVILTLLASLVGPRLLDQLGGAKAKTARVQIAEIEQGLDLYKLDVGRYPSEAEGLRALVERPANVPGWKGPYLKKGLPLDPWNNAYQYTPVGRHGGPDIYSLGADGKPGGEGDDADIYN